MSRWKKSAGEELRDDEAHDWLGEMPRMHRARVPMAAAAELADKSRKVQTLAGIIALAEAARDELDRAIGIAKLRSRRRPS